MEPQELDLTGGETAVFVCHECASDVVFWNAAVDHERGNVNDSFP